MKKRVGYFSKVVFLMGICLSNSSFAFANKIESLYSELIAMNLDPDSYKSLSTNEIELITISEQNEFLNFYFYYEKIKELDYSSIQVELSTLNMSVDDNKNNPKSTLKALEHRSTYKSFIKYSIEIDVDESIPERYYTVFKILFKTHNSDSQSSSIFKSYIFSGNDKVEKSFKGIENFKVEIVDPIYGWYLRNNFKTYNNNDYYAYTAFDLSIPIDKMIDISIGYSLYDLRYYSNYFNGEQYVSFLHPYYYGGRNFLNPKKTYFKEYKGSEQIHDMIINDKVEYLNQAISDFPDNQYDSKNSGVRPVAGYNKSLGIKTVTVNSDESHYTPGWGWFGGFSVNKIQKVSDYDGNSVLKDKFKDYDYLINFEKFEIDYFVGSPPYSNFGATVFTGKYIDKALIMNMTYMIDSKIYNLVVDNDFSVLNREDPFENPLQPFIDFFKNIFDFFAKNGLYMLLLLGLIIGLPVILSLLNLFPFLLKAITCLLKLLFFPIKLITWLFIPKKKKGGD